MFALLSLLCLLSPVSQDDQEARIAKLVQDLGSDEFATREAAEKELAKIGAAAVPQLKKALEDRDAERADRARRVLAEIEKSQSKPEKKPGLGGGVRLSSRDLSRGVTFDLYPDGRVELTVPEEDKETGKKVYKTYKAESMDAFKEKHPEIARQYEIDKFMPRVEWKHLDQNEFENWWQDWKRRFDEEWGKNRDEMWKEWKLPLDEDFEKWVDEQRKRIEELRRKRLPPLPDRETPTEGGREFGIKIEPVNETLAAQLDLKEGEGVQISEVKAGSLAEKAGLKRHDVVLKLNGAAITDKWAFRRQVRELVGKEFELEIIRTGKRETVKVKSE
jgi:hypothetical protein